MVAIECGDDDVLGIDAALASQLGDLLGSVGDVTCFAFDLARDVGRMFRDPGVTKMMAVLSY